MEVRRQSTAPKLQKQGVKIMKKQTNQFFPNRDIAIAIGVGLTLGAALDNIAFGLAIGIIIWGIGTLWKQSAAKSRRNEDDTDNPGNHI
jgi:hypothetical protein